MKKSKILCLALFSSFISLSFSAPSIAIDELRGTTEIHSETDGVNEPEITYKPILPSRSVELKKNQSLDIEYPGKGWIYLGEMEAENLFKYSGRKMNDEETSFSLKAVHEGDATLHFYKNDALTGEFIDDYLTVKVAGSGMTSERVTAPSYAKLVPPQTDFTKNTLAKDDNEETEVISSYTVEVTTEVKDDVVAAKTEEPNKNTQTSNDNSKSDLAEKEVLELAQKSYDDGDYEKCLAYLEDFFSKSVELTDAGLFLEGQALEAPSSSRNIKKALAAYKSIISGFPESSKWDQANARVTYIQRLYFSIR